MPMYEGAGNGPLWWVAYLAIAITVVTSMMLLMLRGIARAGQATAPRPAAEPEAAPVADEQPHRIGGGHDDHPTLSGAA